MKNFFEIDTKTKEKVDLVHTIVNNIHLEEKDHLTEALHSDEGKVPKWQMLQYALYEQMLAELFTTSGALTRVLEMTEEDFEEMAKDHDTTVTEMLHDCMMKMIMDILDK